MADQDVSAPGAGRPPIHGNVHTERYQALHRKRLQAPEASPRRQVRGFSSLRPFPYCAPFLISPKLRPIDIHGIPPPG
jgi:hypothetical protein